jgi:hypothetical protein
MGLLKTLGKVLSFPFRGNRFDREDATIDELADRMFWQGYEIEDNPYPYDSPEGVIWQNSFESTIVTNYGEQALEDYYNGDRGFGGDPYGE